ncbi:IS5 family transposase (plasmid) [Cupriavidus necator]|nr:IS5 family transposase [Cupriavidus necator]UIF88297.1 IS5 family transposase [Cupriavidus necator]
MQQISFASAEYLGKKRVTRREKFLGEMEQVVPWARLLEALEPYYPKGKRGRPPIGLERMLRLYFVQQWYGLSDEALEDAVSDSAAIRNFVGVDLGHEEAPDATTVLKFRRLLEKHKLTAVLFEQINAHLRERGLMMREGTMVDATIINAPTSTKNRDKARDPEMHQTKKRNQWYHGMKAHVGADAESGLVHSTHYTAANESDVAHTHEVQHGQEDDVILDAGYTGVHRRDEILKAQAEGAIKADVRWSVAMKRSRLKGMTEGPLKQLTQALEKVKAQIRARVEHPFHVVKNLFKHKKARYRGLAKNGAQCDTLFALANLVIAKKALLQSMDNSVCKAA